MLHAECKINDKKIISDIDPLVFGNFIEFTHDCINQGMWAELLLNRGFEEEFEEGGMPPHWQATGYNDTGLYRVEEGTPFGHGKCQKIQNVHHFGGYKGIEQKGLLLKEEAGYHISVWAKAVSACPVRLRLLDGGKQILWQTELVLTGQWKKYEVDCIKTEPAENAAFEILLEEEGSVWLDQCSLMPLNAVDGIWQEVFAAVQDSYPTLLRFPGGCFADCYSFADGIGPRDHRPARVNRHWGGMEENNFGTDEFLKLCQNLGCEPMICVNFGSADAREAASWVEYCNGPATTPMGKRRKENGHSKPYHVKFWGIGNETWAEWEIGSMTVKQCAQKFAEFSKAMRAASPEPIELIACGGDGNSESQEWNRLMLKEIGQDAAYLDLHFYAPQLYESPAKPEQIYEAAVYAAHKYEKILRDTADVIKEANAMTRIMVGEYNAMYYNDSNREHTLETALLNAGFLNCFIRNAKLMRIGVFSDLVNGWQGGCIRSRKGEVYRTPSYYVLQLYAGAGITHSLETEMACACVTIEGAGHVPSMPDLPVADSAAAITKEGKLCLFLINRSMDESISVDVSAGAYHMTELQAIEGDDAYSRNTYESEPVCIRTSTPKAQNKLEMLPHSICMAVLEK